MDRGGPLLGAHAADPSRARADDLDSPGAGDGFVDGDGGSDGVAVVRETCEIWDQHGLESMIIAASIRHPIHVLECAKAGADIATVPYKVLQQILKHPLTESGVATFVADHENMMKSKGAV